MSHGFKLLALGLTILLITGCASGSAEGSQANYEETKKMLVDLLKSDDGKKAIQEVMSDEEIKKQLVMEQPFVKETIQKVLTTEEGKAYWQEMLKDPAFVENFAKNIQSENEKLFKSLMDDPEYQEKMMDLLQDPVMEKHYLQLLESKQSRQQIKDLISETFESPLFHAKIQEMLTGITSEQLKSSESGNKKDENTDNTESDSGEGSNSGQK
ncbi:spore gernimation protein GerD [Alkalihalobacillus hwajinpoensis]|uniref:spore germination lipoprotein GerD n=1 Tax=Guptibacillus hwajinpoensis TaxID=208199 RepID=UPI001883D992|nr:spore germination lipoprotein GerD [Pseudalkalibacillus hwajinpoensis]MBF0707227.1 spore gernimation protein GerD [Pseudalkalibacillus hwajinpoensis]